MLMRRVIPCLDVKDGRVVKGVQFETLVDKGDPVAAAAAYDAAGADELVFLDISASVEGRRALLDVVARVADQVFIPLTVGGGVSHVDHVHDLLRAGADKVGINSAAVKDPPLVTRAAERFGSQCVVVAVDAKRVGDRWEVFTHGGRNATGLDALTWCEDVVARGAGELLLTSIDRDGTKIGYDLELLKAVRARVGVPVIASGGAGALHHFVAAAQHADGVLAASLFHDGTLTIDDVKKALAEAGLPARLRPHRASSTPAPAASPTAPRRDPVPVYPQGATPKFDASGLLPAIITDAATGEVLTLAYMNADSWQRTVASGETWLWSRSRGELWHKGATSGHTQEVLSLSLDCDSDAVVVRVVPRGPACHTGQRSCFASPAGGALVRLDDVLADRALRLPPTSYTVKLLLDENKRTKKLGEELAELLRALYVGSDDDVSEEAADLLYHAAVSLRARGISLSTVMQKLLDRG